MYLKWFIRTESGIQFWSVANYFQKWHIWATLPEHSKAPDFEWAIKNFEEQGKKEQNWQIKLKR